ncbi:cupin domain-containing protein [Neolewinella antarctica]|uniref:Quercetin dioxygenase-like cupin family protein n=1 Tax=Neolewinella antarctica TaxID=442734 RepID=A0ABX0X7K0_9BACT|nr:cupin domain-containing protein [Neolewinella antarctica]NJC25224.1 quercetin dioxygenase-like cupin family protein [Neolewinella antarctica]
MRKIVNIKEKYAQFSDHWSPRVVGELNGQQVKLAKVSGELVWHDHATEDELFLVQRGTFYLEFRDGTTVELKEGEFYIVPRGVEHLPYTKNGEEAWLLLLEPATTKHTGNVDHALTQRKAEFL